MNSLDLIKKLRAESRYEEAYQMSLNDLKEKPKDLWAARIHCWSIYYLIKKHVQAGQSAQAKHYLSEFDQLEMPAEETLIHERIGYFRTVLQENYLRAKALISQGNYREAFEVQVAEEKVHGEELSWTMYYLLRGANKSGVDSVSDSIELWGKFQQKVVPGRKLVYKLILQELVKSPESWWNEKSQSEALEYLGLFDQLEEEDYLKPEVEGKKLMSLAERLHIVYSKALLREKASEAKILNYLAKVVDPLLEGRNQMEYVAYFKAKLLLGTGDRKKGMQVLLPFVRKKQGEFWVWQVLAEANEEDDSVYLACLCKAAECSSKPEFLSGIRERLIGFLVRKADYGWAAAELDVLMQVREKMGWGLRSHHRQYMGSDWYAKNKGMVDIRKKYQEHVSIALQLLEEEGVYESERVLVTGLNKEKRLFYFLTEGGEEKQGKFKELPEIWGVYQVWGEWQSDRQCRVHRMSRVEGGDLDQVFFKEVKENLRMGRDQAFGFLDDVFVEPKVIEQNGLKSGMRVHGLAVRTKVKGKNELGWKLLKVIKE